MRERAPTTGSVATALAHASRLLSRRPDLAEKQAREVLAVAPGHPDALAVLGAARRRAGDAAGGRPLLERAARERPDSAFVWCELGRTLSRLGEGEGAETALRRAVTLDPWMVDAWRTLADHLHLSGDRAAADAVYAEQIRAAAGDPELMRAAALLVEGRLAVAERLLRDRLKRAPTDVAAVRMLAEVGTRLGRLGDADKLLTRCLELAPGFAAARHNHAVVLYRLGRAEEALAALDRLLSAAPDDASYRNLRAAALGRIGDYDEAIAVYDGLLAEHPGHAKVWMSYGHALKTAGRRDDSIAAYRECARLQPTLGEAYWSLANLKTYRFSPGEAATMAAAVERPGLAADDRLHLEFSLGKAAEDAGDWAGSFRHYAAGNAIRRGQVVYDADADAALVARSKALFTPSFFAERAGRGSADPDPIFVVGLPRSGSTLVEQILASHSAVEGTMELPEINAIALRLGERRRLDQPSAYPEALESLDADGLAALGREFIDRTRVQRKLGRPFFIDKMPNNFQHIGLIHLILPNAKIIDARRHPVASCFSAFKQHFARGQTFTYDLGELGRYYRDYVELMAHVDAVLPGRVHRVIYEDLVADTETQVRRLLDHCGLPFEEGCLRFHENRRAVRTASSEQVRRPIFSDAVEQWRNYEPWLGPLKAALGPALEDYRGT